jgi:hypothetical protein
MIRCKAIPVITLLIGHVRYIIVFQEPISCMQAEQGCFLNKIVSACRD